MGLLNRWPAKRAQKVKGTHTVSLEREKSIYVSSALNAYQAIDILLKNLKSKKPPTRQNPTRDTILPAASHIMYLA